MNPIDMVIIGHVSRDVIVVDQGEQEELGGAAYFASFAAKPAGIKLLVITKLSLRDYTLLDDFWAHGIPVLPIVCRRTTAMIDRFNRADGYKRTSQIISRAAPFRLSDIPVQSATIYYLGALMSGEISAALLEALASRGKVALDVQGMLRIQRGRSLVMRDWKHKERYLSRVNFLKADMDEARLLTGDRSTEKIIQRIHDWGVAELIITENGGVTVSDGTDTHFRPFEHYEIAARSGRGDTCFASFLSYRLSHTIEEAVEYCQKITNLKLRSPGPYRPR